MTRYTPKVGKWHLRAVTILVAAMIGGGQTVIILCNASCDTSSKTTTTTLTNDVIQDAHHHHASDNESPAPRPDRDANVTSTHLPNLHRVVNVAPDTCCTTLSSAPATVAPVRAMLIGSHVLASIEPMAVDLSRGHFGPTTHAPPPGEFSSERTSLPLRI